MKIGLYDQKIQFASGGQESDGYGGYNPVMTVQLETRARIKQLKISGNIEQAQLQLPTTYRVGVKARSGFTPSVQNIVIWKGQNYRIINAPVVESVRYQKEWVFDITAKQ
jgi:hypothetical protein